MASVTNIKSKDFIVLCAVNDLPQLEDHCKHSFKRYGIRGDDIHSWMDEPSQLSGGSHRTYRHDLESLPIAIKMFEAKYGAEMVENIFLDHLKADSEESRKQKTKAEMDMAWSTEDDNILSQHFLEKIEVLEPLFNGRYTRKDIRYRQRYLGIIRPTIFKYKKARLLKMSFSLKAKQKLNMEIDVLEGGNRDIDFCIGNTKRIGNSFKFQTRFTRIKPYFELEYTAKFTGKHWFNFSNLFSVWTSKRVSVKFRLEKGRTLGVEFKL